MTADPKPRTTRTCRNCGHGEDAHRSGGLCESCRPVGDATGAESGCQWFSPRDEARQPLRTTGEQARFRLSPASMQHIKRIAKRTRLRQNQVVDQLVGESLRLEREVKKLGFQHVGEALAVLKAMQEGR